MKLPQICLFLGALSGALFFTGCATVTRGTHEALVIETEPSGAQVRLSTGLTGSTPTSFRIPRKGGLVVTITKEGYETVTVNVTTQVAGAGAAGMAGNVLIGGIIGIGIDSFSGGTLEHKPNPVKVTLVALKPPAVLPVAAAPVAPTSPPPLAPVDTPAEAPAPAAAEVPTPAAASVESSVPVSPVTSLPPETPPSVPVAAEAPPISNQTAPVEAPEPVPPEKASDSATPANPVSTANSGSDAAKS